MAEFPAFKRAYSGPSSSSSSHSSTQYDYTGLDEHLKKQQVLAGLRDAKFAALYGGDVAGSVTAGSQIRDLVHSLQANDPGANERDPMRLSNPFVRVAGTSTGSSDREEGPSWSASDPLLPLDPPAPPAPEVNRVLGVDANQQREMGRDKLKGPPQPAGLPRVEKQFV